jgi:dethiobiotin synthetase
VSEAVAGRSIFITGTDTGVGKTHVAQGLLRAARRQGIRACGFKPVASGCRSTPAGLRNADALGLQAAAGTCEPYEVINPYAFKPAIAPHLAARAAGQRIDPRRLDAAQRRLAAAYEWVLIEGAGGWQVPLNAKLGFADWVELHRWPVLLVVGLRLGCINHALLSAE